jgi:hypothetical protein
MENIRLKIEVKTAKLKTVQINHCSFSYLFYGPLVEPYTNLQVQVENNVLLLIDNVNCSKVDICWKRIVLYKKIEKKK